VGGGVLLVSRDFILGALVVVVIVLVIAVF
jgi:hypothetical protein